MFTCHIFVSETLFGRSICFYRCRSLNKIDVSLYKICEEVQGFIKGIFYFLNLIKKQEGSFHTPFS